MPEQTPTPEINTQPAAPKSDAPTAQVRDKRILPEGVVPKQAQAYVVAGLAVLILMAVLFSKNHARPAPKESTPPPASVSTDMNQQRIHELEQDLSADQRQMQQQQKAQAQKENAAGLVPDNASSAQTSGGAPA